MKKSAKKVLSVLLAILMLVSCGLVAASAAEADYELLYGIEGSVGSRIKCYITGYGKSLGDEGLLHIPSTSVTGNNITILFSRVADRAFAFFNSSDTNAVKYSDEIKEIVIDAGVSLIGSYAFYNLANLEKVTFEGDVELGDFAFANCANLKNVVFKGKNVKVGASAFAGCANLASVQFESDVELLTGVNAFNETKWFAEYPTDFIIAGSTLVAYVGSDADVTFPLNITKIGNGAFKNNATLQTVNYTNNIVSIGDEAFKNCSALKTVNYAEFGEFDYVGVDVYADTPYYNNYEGDFFCIGDRLIEYLGSDVYVIIPNTVKEIASNAFLGCYTKSGDGTISYQISSIRVPASVEVCEEDCFTLYTVSDSTPHAPLLYVYANTPAASLVAQAGYNHVVLGAPGDVDIDSVVSPADARAALRFSVGLSDPTPEETYMADVDGDLAVTVSDARMILRVAVGLDEISAETLLSKPSTPAEILQYYSKVLDKAARLRAGYTKEVTGAYASDITDSKDCSIDANTYLYLKPVVNDDTSVVNSTRSYESNTDAAAENLIRSSLISTNAIKSASCILSDGKYYINIVLKDEEAVTDDTFVSDIYPVAARSHFDALLASKSWFQSQYNWLSYDLYYKNCTISAVVDVNTQQIQSIDMSVTYFFDEIDGVINLIHVTDWGRNHGTGYASRFDTLSYSDFVY